MEHEPLDPDGTLSILVASVNALSERQDNGPGVVLTVRGLVISGEVIPNWQWHQDVGKEARAAYLQAGGDPEAEHRGGWVYLFEHIADDLSTVSNEHRAARAAADALAPRYGRAIAQSDSTAFIHLQNAKVYAPGQAGFPPNGMRWRGRLTQVDGWVFGAFEPPHQTGA